MKRKNKVMLALALGAVALVIASGAVRCSLATPEPSEESTQEQGRVESSGEAAHEEPSAASFEEAGAQGGFADLKNTTWVSEDGKSALSIIEGAFIESGEAGQSILYYSVESEQTQNDGITATLAVSDSMTGDEELTVAVFQTSSEGERTLTCDKLSCAYVLEEVQATAITVTEADERLHVREERGRLRECATRIRPREGPERDVRHLEQGGLDRLRPDVLSHQLHSR